MIGDVFGDVFGDGAVCSFRYTTPPNNAATINNINGARFSFISRAAKHIHPTAVISSPNFAGRNELIELPIEVDKRSI